MRGLARKEQVLKGWNIRLKVSHEEEQKIKMEALKKGMGISQYIKQTILDNLSVSTISTEGKSS